MIMKNLENYGALVLASRLRRLSEQFYSGVDDSYLAAGVTLSSRCFPLLFLLRDNGPSSITVLADQMGQSHPAIVQLSRKLLAADVVTEHADPKDERRRLLALSNAGRALLARMVPLWDDVCAALDVALDGDAPALLAIVERAERRLAAAPFGLMIAARRRERETAAAVEIVDYTQAWAADFKRLNIEWLERYFYVEEVDDANLSDPHGNILAPGGRIVMARLGDDIIGTCALINAGEGRLELSKMAVTPRCQGLGVGRRLIEKAIGIFHDSPFQVLFLESNTKLRPAVALYESVGFRHVARPATMDSHYQRANVYMELQA